jgi:hypothetical protein
MVVPAVMGMSHKIKAKIKAREKEKPKRNPLLLIRLRGASNRFLMVKAPRR